MQCVLDSFKDLTSLSHNCGQGEGQLHTTHASHHQAYEVSVVSSEEKYYKH